MEQDEQRFEAYLQRFREWGTPAEMRMIFLWATPEEVRAILKELGPPEEAITTVQAAKRMRERDEWWAAFWRRTREGLIWIGLVGGVLGAILAGRAVASFLVGI